MKKATKNGLIALAATIGIISVHSAAHAQSLLPGEHDWQPWDIVETIPGEHGKTFCIADNKSLYECGDEIELFPYYEDECDYFDCPPAGYAYDTEGNLRATGLLFEEDLWVLNYDENSVYWPIEEVVWPMPNSAIVSNPY